MSFGNLVQRPDLSPFFGPLSAEENDKLLDRLLVIDAAIANLAEHASAYVGVPYATSRLGFFLRENGSAAGIGGGPTGDAGDIWFDVDVSDDNPTRDPHTGSTIGPPWVVESFLIVFCVDSPEHRGDPSIHTLARMEGSANTPSGVLDVLESHVSAMRVELDRHSREVLTMSTHAQLLERETP